jgi:phage shock protein E
MILRRLAPAVLALALLGGCSPAATTAPAASGAVQQKQNLTAAEFSALTQQSGVTLVDVRTPAEFASGHLKGAQNIDIEAADFDARVAALAKDGSYALYCRSGNRSGQALVRMTATGFTKVAHLVGGVGAWQAAGFKLVS